MILRRIEVRNFRKLVGPVVIDLDAGLNVIFGNNEEGKSTLLQALRSAFFDRYNTSVATAYRPYGSESQPEVTVNFEVNGVSYRLNKKFCSPPKATLTCGSECLENARVDEKLKELLQFKAVNGQSQPRDHGLWGMLWLSQGEGFEGFAANPEGTRTIQQALGEEVGAMLGGEKGEAVLKQATEDSQEFFTPTLRSNKAYKELLSDLEGRESELGRLKNELANFEQRQQQLESSSEELAELIAQRTLELAAERHSKASTAVAEIEQLRSQQTDADAKRQRAEAAKSLAVQKADSRQLLVESVQRLEREIEKQSKRLEELAPAIARANASISETSAVVSEWKQKQANLLKDIQQLQAAIQVLRYSADLARAEASLVAAQAAAAARQRVLGEAALISVTHADVNRARKLETAALMAAQQLENVATNVTLDLDQGIVVTIAGEVLSGKVERHFTEPATVLIPGVGKITVIPGGDLEHLREAKSNTAAAVKEVLSAMHFVSAEEMASALAKKTSYEAEAESQRALEKMSAPAGIAALSTSVAELKVRLQAAMASLQGPLPAGEDFDAKLLSANEELARVQGELSKAEQEAEALSLDKARLATELADCTARVSQSSSDLERSSLELTNARTVASDASLDQEVLLSDQGLTSANKLAKVVADALAARKPQEVEHELEQAKAAVVALQLKKAELEGRIRDLGAELRGWGQKNLGEQVRRAESELVGAKRTFESKRRRAEALRLLVETMRAAKEEATQSFLEPVIRHMAPYIDQLFPNAKVQMKDDWQIEEIKRNELAESFDALSMGTKEQLSILCRLALADVMADRKLFSTVILDDAIVFSDDERFARMLAILSAAAARSQIIFFTCRTHAFADVAGAHLRLKDCVQPKAIGTSPD